MIIGIALKIILVVVAISIIQIAYNSVVYRQVGKIKWVKFIPIVAIVLLGGYFLFSSIKPFTDLRYISNVVDVIDTVFFTFFGYLPKNIIIVWFVLPIVITWIAYLFITLTTVIKNRYKYFNWKKKIEANEKEVNEQEPEYDDKEKETIITHLDKGLEDENEDNVHFLSEPMAKIRYKSILGLQRAYEISKEKGLQLAESDTGYVAVYADKTGVSRLKELMNENNIDYSKLKNRPSIVFFDSSTIQCVSIKEAFEKIKGGESIV